MTELLQVVHASKYPSPIMSMDLSQSMWTMAVGTSSGDLFIRRKKKVVQADTEAAGSMSGIIQEPRKAGRVLRPTNYRYFLRGRMEEATVLPTVCIQVLNWFICF